MDVIDESRIANLLSTKISFSTLSWFPCVNLVPSVRCPPSSIPYDVVMATVPGKHPRLASDCITRWPCNFDRTPRPGRSFVQHQIRRMPRSSYSNWLATQPDNDKWNPSTPGLDNAQHYLHPRTGPRHQGFPFGIDNENAQVSRSYSLHLGNHARAMRPSQRYG